MRYLKEFIREVLKEGVKEDLIKLDPTLSSDFEKMESFLSLNGVPVPKQVKYLRWYSKFKKENPDQKESVESILESILDFERKASRIKSKNLSTDLMSYKNIADLRSAIESILSEKERDIVAGSSDYDVVYESDEWIVKFPRSAEASIAIAQPGKTNWCTAETQGTNAFCNYVMKKNKTWNNLYYIIRKKLLNNQYDYMSVGYEMNKIPEIILGKKEGMSVDKNNNALAEDTLKKVLKNEYDTILNSMFSHANKILNSGMHPFQKKLSLAGQNISDFNKIWNLYSSKDKSDIGIQSKKDFLMSVINNNDNIPKEIISKILDISKIFEMNEMDEVLILIAAKASDQVVLKELSTSESAKVRQSVAKNQYTKSDILKYLSKDNSTSVIESVAENDNTDLDTLKYILNNVNSERYIIGRKLAANKNLTANMLKDLSKNAEDGILSRIINHPNTPDDLKQKLTIQLNY